MQDQASKLSVWIGSVSLALIALGAPGSAVASCVQPPPLTEAVGEADVVFVGLVTEVSNRQRNAVVEVEVVWKGDVDERVEVRGGPQRNDTISSVDAAYNEGERYLFVPYEGEGDLFRDNACTSTQPYEDYFEELRPAGAVVLAPSPSPTATGDVFDTGEARDVAEPPGRSRWIVPGALALVVAAAVTLWLRRRPDGLGGPS